jgi:hypothetical protein
MDTGIMACAMCVICQLMENIITRYTITELWTILSAIRLVEALGYGIDVVVMCDRPAVVVLSKYLSGQFVIFFVYLAHVVGALTDIATLCTLYVWKKRAYGVQYYKREYYSAL